MGEPIRIGSFPLPERRTAAAAAAAVLELDARRERPPRGAARALQAVEQHLPPPRPPHVRRRRDGPHGEDAQLPRVRLGGHMRHPRGHAAVPLQPRRPARLGREALRPLLRHRARPGHRTRRRDTDHHRRDGAPPRRRGAAAGVRRGHQAPGRRVDIQPRHARQDGERLDHMRDHGEARPGRPPPRVVLLGPRVHDEGAESRAQDEDREGRGIHAAMKAVENFPNNESLLRAAFHCLRQLG
ncbi:hypothetical protein THAOC_16224 [Thalassiosira oceanica]|uniref:Uncharacterized protein n=1 Tax=Thalassiosira oceanica TaxID=159749 RepID=K0SY58_THAOC|nr:hypothetical protein THAOC_16224 [Thalassiosira oceanica]|eukprot:EJK63137.1 hypothetical protein THAOC_16224 [Thalassiosira oceanica]